LQGNLNRNSGELVIEQTKTAFQKVNEKSGTL